MRILQIESKPDIALNNILDKFGTILQDNIVDMDEYKNTKLYIKPKDGMVYFDLPYKKIAKDKQQFSLYD